MSENQLATTGIDDLCINTIRTLSMDAVQKANSGHPGTPMALAPLMYLLWSKFLRHNPNHPQWFDRDRFILSNGHASMLLYSLLYLTGYDLTLEDIKEFRQWGSKTPGHPEYGLTPGVETTTGPLGQGFMNAVGMAIAESRMASQFNRNGFDVVHHYTYVFMSDGDMMEGASHEAASIAGHLGLNKLICFYDDNHISIEGKTEITFSDDVQTRFEGYHWHVQNLGDNANNLGDLQAAIVKARQEASKPSLIIVRSHIAFGAPTLHDTPEAHGSPLGADEVKGAKRAYGWPEEETFSVPERALKYMRKAVEQGRYLEAEWQKMFAAYEEAHPRLAKRFKAALELELPEGWEHKVPSFEASEKGLATRAASGKIVNALGDVAPWLVGGSADLAPSTKTLFEESGYIAKENYDNRNIAWGVREHAMCGCSSGMALHGGMRPFVSTFLIFSDYARPAIRLAALMKLPIIYVMTHDSIGLGEDGPTHQPIEHLASLRAIPHLCVIRPADANEAAFAWQAAIARTHGPTMLVLTRQNVPVFDRTRVASAAGVLKGAYILSKEDRDRPDLILLGSGSEVQLILAAQEQLARHGVAARVISMPSWEIFAEQPKSYRDEVLPSAVGARLAIEAGSPLGWRQWVGDKGEIIGLNRFGASAPGNEVFKHLGFTVENVVEKSMTLLNHRTSWSDAANQRESRLEQT
jgi:transketolase